MSLDLGRTSTGSSGQLGSSEGMYDGPSQAWVLEVQDAPQRTYLHVQNVLRYAAQSGVIDNDQLAKILEYMDQFVVPVASREELAEAAFVRARRTPSTSIGSASSDEDDGDALAEGAEGLALGEVVEAEDGGASSASLAAAGVRPSAASVSSGALAAAAAATAGATQRLSRHKLSVEAVAAIMEHPINGVKIGKRTHHLRTYHNVFVGREAVQWMLDRGYADDEPEAVALGRKMVDRGFIVHAVGDHQFENKTLFYRFSHHPSPLTTMAPKLAPGTASLPSALLRLVYAVHEDRVEHWLESANAEHLQVAFPAVLMWAKQNPLSLPAVTARLREMAAADRALLLSLVGFSRANNNACLDQSKQCSFQMQPEDLALLELTVDGSPPGPAVSALQAAGRPLQHPFLNRVASSVRLNKEFTSAARPAWISFMDADGQKMLPDAVIKGGDDLRKDLAVQLIFQAAAAFWAAAPAVWRTGRAPEVSTFRVMVTSPLGGYLEFVRGTTVKEVSAAHGWDKVDLKDLAPSIVGGLVASFVLGIRDRHSENVMLLEAETRPRLLQIDFGYMLMEAPGGLALDTPRLTLQPDLVRLLKRAPGHNADHTLLEDIQHDMVTAFKLLREHYPAFVSFSKTVLSTVYPPSKVEAHFWGRHAFHAGQTDLKTVRWFEEKVLSQLVESNLRRGAKAAIVKGYYSFKAMTAK